MIHKGTFKYELKNRFLCLVNINGVDTICYIPSSSKLGNYLDLRNKEVLLKPTKSEKTHLAVYAIRYKQNYITLDMNTPNQVIETEIKRRYFSFLGKRSNVQKEKSICGYKCDLFIDDTNTIIEIKSILSNEKHALFPTVHSDRANQQLSKISELLDSGYNVCYCFVSLNPYVRSITLNKNEFDYFNLFKTCTSKGMIVKGFAIRLVNEEPTICRELPIIIE